MQAVPQGTNMQPGGAVSVRVGSALGPALATIGLLLSGCGDASASPERERLHTPGCQAPEGALNQPRSIDETIQLANALPKPLSLACFVEALGRPLPLHASRSEISAQPALGTRSPRIFVYLEPLVMSVVPAGAGAHLLELGEQRPDFRSLKAELKFPIVEAIEPAAPYEQTLFTPDLTACAFCHAAEERDPLLPDAPAYVSQSLRPFSHQRVPLATLRDELLACDVALEPERCRLLDALLGWGKTPDWEFPSEMATFGG